MPRRKINTLKKPMGLSDYPPVLSPHQAADLLHISPNSLYAMLHTQTIPFFKIGSHFKIPKIKLALMFGLVVEHDKMSAEKENP